MLDRIQAERALQMAQVFGQVPCYFHTMTTHYLYDSDSKLIYMFLVYHEYMCFSLSRLATALGGGCDLRRYRKRLTLLLCFGW